MLEVSSRGVVQSIVLKDLDQIPIEVRRCIASIKDTKEGVAVSFHSPHPSLERLSKYHGLIGTAAFRQIETDISPESAWEHSLEAAAWLEEFAMKHALATVDDVVKLLRTKHE